MSAPPKGPIQAPTVRSYARIEPGPAWLAGTDVYGQDADVLLAHLRHMAGLFDQGRLLVGGPEDHGMAGFVLLDSTDLAEAAADLAADPCVQAGIFRFRLHRLAPYFDRFTRP